MLDSILIVIALEMGCILLLLIAICAVRSRNQMKRPHGGRGNVVVSRNIDETATADAVLSEHDMMWSADCACEGDSYDDTRLSQGFSVTHSALYRDSKPRHTEDWLEQEARFFYGPERDRTSDCERGNAIGFMNMYALDMALFGDADGDGLPDHPDWDADFEDDSDWFDFDLG